MTCPNIQMRLNDIHSNYPSEATPVLSFLNSPENRARIMSQMVAGGNSKKKTIQVVYDQRRKESDVRETLTTGCTEGLDGDTSIDYTIDETDGVEAGQKFVLADLHEICETNEDFIARKTMSLLDVLRRKLESKMTFQLASEAGRFATNDTTGVSSNIKSVATKDSSGRLIETALAEIKFSARQAAFTNTPVVIGSNEIEKYYDKLYASCCNQYGLDIPKFTQGSSMFLPSYRLASELGNSGTDFFVMDMGSAFMLQFNKFEGMDGFNTVNNGSTVQGTIVDPYTGLSFNYKWVYAPCGEQATLTISTAAVLKVLPDDMFQSTDRLYMTNGILRFRVANP